MSSTSDTDIVQVIKSYLAGIGIDLEIRVLDPVAATRFVQSLSHDAMSLSGVGGTGPLRILLHIIRLEPL